MNDDQADVRCAFCPATSDLDRAIEDGWIPSALVGSDRVVGPVCPDCAVRHCNYDRDDCEYQVNPGHEANLRRR
jgi:hypothetical protein